MTSTADAPLPAALTGIDPASLVLLLDIDGVLAPLVVDHHASEVPQATLAAVAAAHERAALVGVITGRTLERARELVPVEGIWMAAAHGALVAAPDGTLTECDVSAAAREHVQVAAQLAQTVGWHYEDKGHSVTVHLRQRGNLGQSVDPRQVRAQLQMVLNLLKVEIHEAKLALEVKPKGARTKGYAVEHMVAAARAMHGDAGPLTVVYAGDDVTDLDAFTALDTIAAERDDLRAIKLAVGGERAPEALLEAADIVVMQDQVAGLIRGLVGA